MRMGLIMSSDYIPIESLLNDDGKITYRTWRTISDEKRGEILDVILDGDYNENILSLIAPGIQKKILPDDYQGIQRQWQIGRSPQYERSRGSLDILRAALQEEFSSLANIMRENQGQQQQQQQQLIDIVSTLRPNQEEAPRQRQESVWNPWEDWV